jgi:hypothetical protein
MMIQEFPFYMQRKLRSARISSQRAIANGTADRWGINTFEDPQFASMISAGQRAIANATNMMVDPIAADEAGYLARMRGSNP